MAGYKSLTHSNWMERDVTNEAFGRLDPGSGRAVGMSGNDWAERFLSVHLNAGVPQDVRDLFEVARGTMLYGHFFYPLYTLGDEQLHRVADAAALERHRQLGGPLTKRGQAPPFFERIKWLVEHGAIPKAEAARWHAYREPRNMASHPEMQTLQTPGSALSSLELVARSVGDLFRPPALLR